MCQIIALKVKDTNVIEFMKKYKEDIKADLHEKGGDGYSFFFQPLNRKPIIARGYNFKKVYYKFLDKLRNELLFRDEYGILVLFSRQKPEMENERVNLPPYYNKSFKMHFFVHGTIYNDKELAEKYQAKITVDSEILTYIPKTESDIISSIIEPLKGAYSIIGVGRDNKIVAINNGMGIWRSVIHNDLTHSAIYKMTPTNRKYFKYGSYIKPYKSDLKTVDHLVVSYSGGMDVTLSAYYAIHNWLNSTEFDKNSKSYITLAYFKYGTKAEKQELEALTRFKKYIIKLLNIKGYDNVKVMVKIFDFKPIYDGFDGKSKLTQENAVGDIKESEANIAYVPFRNLLFATRLAHYIQDYKDVDLTKRKKIVFGLNLTEGQVYCDNNQAFLENANNTIQLAGKYFDRTIEIVAPFVNKTKSNMIKQFIHEFGLKRFKDLINISFSCYYPNPDGSPCGKCGSCILREKALEEALKN